MPTLYQDALTAVIQDGEVAFQKLKKLLDTLNTMPEEAYAIDFDKPIIEGKTILRIAIEKALRDEHFDRTIINLFTLALPGAIICPSPAHAHNQRMLELGYFI